MTNTLDTMKLALGALEVYATAYSDGSEAITALRQSIQQVEEQAPWDAYDKAMAEQAQPFGYFKAEPFGWTDCAETDEGAIALYATPPQRKPLSDEEIDALPLPPSGTATVRDLVRIIEAAHGIKENT